MLPPVYNPRPAGSHQSTSALEWEISKHNTKLYTLQFKKTLLHHIVTYRQRRHQAIDPILLFLPLSLLLLRTYVLTPGQRLHCCTFTAPWKKTWALALINFIHHPIQILHFLLGKSWGLPRRRNLCFLFFVNHRKALYQILGNIKISPDPIICFLFFVNHRKQPYY